MHDVKQLTLVDEKAANNVEKGNELDAATATLASMNMYGVALPFTVTSYRWRPAMNLELEEGEDERENRDKITEVDLLEPACLLARGVEGEENLDDDLPPLCCSQCVSE